MSEISQQLYQIVLKEQSSEYREMLGGYVRVKNEEIIDYQVGSDTRSFRKLLIKMCVMVLYAVDRRYECQATITRHSRQTTSLDEECTTVSEVEAALERLKSKYRTGDFIPETIEISVAQNGKRHRYTLSAFKGAITKK